MADEPIQSYPTMLSAFIKELQNILEEDGDMPVTAVGSDYRTARLWVAREGYYYDGGYLLPAEDTRYHCRRWIRSRTRPGTPCQNRSGHHWVAHIHAGAPEQEWDETPDEQCDTLDGEPVRGLGSRIAFEAEVAKEQRPG